MKAYQLMYRKYFFHYDYKLSKKYLFRDTISLILFEMIPYGLILVHVRFAFSRNYLLVYYKTDKGDYFLDFDFGMLFVYKWDKSEISF